MIKIKKFFNAMIFIGLLIAIGTAGAYDIDAINVLQTLRQMAMVVVIVSIGSIGSTAIKRKI